MHEFVLSAFRFKKNMSLLTLDTFCFTMLCLYKKFSFCKWFAFSIWPCVANSPLFAKPLLQNLCFRIPCLWTCFGHVVFPCVDNIRIVFPRDAAIKILQVKMKTLLPNKFVVTDWIPEPQSTSHWDISFLKMNLNVELWQVMSTLNWWRCCTGYPLSDHISLVRHGERTMQHCEKLDDLLLLLLCFLLLCPLLVGLLFLENGCSSDCCGRCLVSSCLKWMLELLVLQLLENGSPTTHAWSATGGWLLLINELQLIKNQIWKPRMACKSSNANGSGGAADNCSQMIPNGKLIPVHRFDSECRSPLQQMDLQKRSCASAVAHWELVKCCQTSRANIWKHHKQKWRAPRAENPHANAATILIQQYLQFLCACLLPSVCEWFCQRPRLMMRIDHHEPKIPKCHLKKTDCMGIIPSGLVSGTHTHSHLRMHCWC